jgi:hypothetical protein
MRQRSSIVQPAQVGQDLFGLRLECNKKVIFVEPSQLPQLVEDLIFWLSKPDKMAIARSLRRELENELFSDPIAAERE